MNEKKFRLYNMELYTVEIEDEQGNRSSVFQQGDGKWKCLRCQRYRCEHALFVKATGVTPPGLPPLSQHEIDDILTY